MFKVNGRVVFEVSELNGSVFSELSRSVLRELTGNVQSELTDSFSVS